MTYAAGDWRVVVRGALCDGAESWFNSWTVKDPGGTEDPTDLAVAFQTLYTDIFDLEISSHTTRVGATARNLLTSATVEMSIGTDAGNDLADPMPSQVAARVSLSSSSVVRGGPFIAGWSKNAGDDSGLLSSANQTGLATAVEDFWATIDGLGWVLSIDRPSVETTVPVAAARVGQRFDVIRKRANDIAEAYVTVTSP